ncbi:hypothetical protein [Peptoclostridium litorale]|nr:hypothetical protein [Peptoclostridium litorale]
MDNPADFAVAALPTGSAGPAVAGNEKPAMRTCGQGSVELLEQRRELIRVPFLEKTKANMRMKNSICNACAGFGCAFGTMNATKKGTGEKSMKKTHAWREKGEYGYVWKW